MEAYDVIIFPAAGEIPAVRPRQSAGGGEGRLTGAAAAGKIVIGNRLQMD